MKLSEYTCNGSRIVLLNSPCGSTLQWDVGRDLWRNLPCLAALVILALTAPSDY